VQLRSTRLYIWLPISCLPVMIVTGNRQLHTKSSTVGEDFSVVGAITVLLSAIHAVIAGVFACASDHHDKSYGCGRCAQTRL